MVRREIRKLEQKGVSMAKNESKKDGMTGEDKKAREKGDGCTLKIL